MCVHSTTVLHTALKSIPASPPFVTYILRRGAYTQSPAKRIVSRFSILLNRSRYQRRERMKRIRRFLSPLSFRGCCVTRLRRRANRLFVGPRCLHYSFFYFFSPIFSTVESGTFSSLSSGLVIYRMDRIAGSIFAGFWGSLRRAVFRYWEFLTFGAPACLWRETNR